MPENASIRLNSRHACMSTFDCRELVFEELLCRDEVILSPCSHYPVCGPFKIYCDRCVFLIIRWRCNGWFCYIRNRRQRWRGTGRMHRRYYSDEAPDPERREGVCKEVLEYARGVAEGARYTDSFCVISGLDTGVCSIDAAGEPRSEGVIIVGTSKLCNRCSNSNSGRAVPRSCCIVSKKSSPGRSSKSLPSLTALTSQSTMRSR